MPGWVRVEKLRPAEAVAKEHDHAAKPNRAVANPPFLRPGHIRCQPILRRGGDAAVHPGRRFPDPVLACARDNSYGGFFVWYGDGNRAARITGSGWQVKNTFRDSVLAALVPG